MKQLYSFPACDILFWKAPVIGAEIYMERIGRQTMKCPYCGYTESKVVDSRPTDDSERIRRRRECLRCQKRFTTYEVVETVPIIVIKKNGMQEPFDREKLLRGVLRACEKRQVPVDFYTMLERTNCSDSQMWISIRRTVLASAA